MTTNSLSSQSASLTTIGEADGAPVLRLWVFLKITLELASLQKALYDIVHSSRRSRNCITKGTNVKGESLRCQQSRAFVQEPTLIAFQEKKTTE